MLVGTDEWYPKMSSRLKHIICSFLWELFVNFMAFLVVNSGSFGCHGMCAGRNDNVGQVTRTPQRQCIVFLGPFGV